MIDERATDVLSAPKSDSERIAMLERRQTDLFKKLQEQKDAIDCINKNTSDLVELFKNAKSGATVIIAMVKFAKWIGGLAVAIAAIWIVFNAIRTGVPPTGVP